jgi:hypothetical protein
MQRQLSTGFWVGIALSVVSALLTVLTIDWPDWIEGLVGVDPDTGSGSSEWGITLAFIVAAVAFAAFAGHTWRRDRHNIGLSGSLRPRPSAGAENVP